jgi:hypothetical protein
MRAVPGETRASRWVISRYGDLVPRFRGRVPNVAVRRTILVLGLVGCDSLANTDYVGQAMFTLQGTLAAPATSADDPVGGLALMWQDAAGVGGPGVASTSVPVAIEFPSTFRAAVPVPPPDVARFRFADSDVELAEGYVVVVADAAASRPDPRGTERVHVLVYLTADAEAGTLAADYLGGPLTAGYHLRRFAAAPTAGLAQADLIERCVASGAARTACVARRGYRLGPIADDDRLRIAVTAP